MPRFGAPSFEDLLAQLREAHERELQALKSSHSVRDGCERSGDVSCASCDLSEERLSLSGRSDRTEPTHSLEPLGGRTVSLRSRIVVPRPVECAYEEFANTGVDCPLSDPRHSLQSDKQAGLKADAKTDPSPNRHVARSLTNGSIFGDIEPRTLDFRVLASQFSQKPWDELTAREKAHLVRHALKPKHWMIAPNCHLMKYWAILHAVALAFVGLATPYEVVYLSKDLVMGFLFVMNRLVDLIFLLDVVLQFFLQVEVQRPHRGGSYMVRDARALRVMYLKSWFLVDVVSIFPFDVLGAVVTSAFPFSQRAKIIRCLKLLRLAKVFSALHNTGIRVRGNVSLGINIGTLRLIRFCIVLLFVSHWMACFWGLVGLTLGAELCGPDGLPTNFGNAGFNQVSWVTELYAGGKSTSDDPCNHVAIYLAALHWAVMTLTSIGYGDIVPVRSGEYAACIICMIIGGVLWAYIVGSVCSIISNRSPVERDYELKTNMLNIAMEEAQVPQHGRKKYREYLKEAKAYERRVHIGKVAESFSPMLRKQLMYQISKDALCSVYYLKEDLDTPSHFLLDIASCLIPRFFPPLESLDSLRLCLCMMDRGTVAHCGRILVHPGVFHEDFIIAQPTYRKATRTVSLTYAQVLVLTRSAIIDALEAHPLLGRKIWKSALKAAFCRAVHMTVVAYRKWKDAAPADAHLTLSEAFDSARGRRLPSRQAAQPLPPDGRQQRL